MRSSTVYLYKFRNNPSSPSFTGEPKCPRNFVASAEGEAQLRRQARSQVQLGNEGIFYLIGACVCYISMCINSHAGIAYPKAPQDGKQVIIAQSIMTSELHLSKKNDIEISEPLQWYGVNTPDVASGRLLSAADTYTSTWIYVLCRKTKVAGAATLFDVDGRLKFSGFFDSSFGEKIQKALWIAESLPQLKDQVF